MRSFALIALLFVILATCPSTVAGSCIVQTTRAAKQKERRTNPPAAENAARQAQAKAKEIFEEGQRYHETGNFDAAIERYSAALEIIPEFVEALYQRGMAHLALKRFDSASADLGRVVDTEKELLPADLQTAELNVRSLFARAHSALGEIRLAQGGPDDAIGHFRRAVELDGNLIRPRVQWASTLMDRGDYARAEEILQRAVQDRLASTDVFLLLGHAQEMNKRPDTALESYSRALALDGKNLAARRRRAALWEAKEQWEKAGEDLAAVMLAQPSVETALTLGRLWLRAKNPDRAATAYGEGLKLDPNNLEIHMSILELSAAARRAEAAAYHADEIVRLASTRAEILGRLGQLMMEVDPRRAANAYSRAAALEPENAVYQIGLGTALVRLRKMPEAIAVLSAAVAKSPQNYNAHANLATALFEQKNYAGATAEFEWIIQNKPDAVVAYYFLGICYDKLQFYPRALQAFEKFIEQADPLRNKAEMENVKYHLPALRHLVDQGKGKTERRKS